ncbi:DUF2934 domain-containing protein [Consotaella aegiceratis]|uniref:DUF2934 domain-containing protein n=1 Tax=Consotaella aegiceratis TaxID=3097961 RepID=UPI002F3E72A8
MTVADHDKISKRAYEIWEQEGRPHGRDQEHWDRARTDVQGASAPASEPAPVLNGTAGAAAPAVKKTRKRAAAKPTEGVSSVAAKAVKAAAKKVKAVPAASDDASTSAAPAKRTRTSVKKPKTTE